MNPSTPRALDDGPFDLVIRGGRVIARDPRYDGDHDVGIRGDRIAAIGPSLPVQRDTTVVDAMGALVMPGLVDVHAHIYWGGTYFGAHPDAVASRTGVTTWADAGSSGAWTFNGLRALADHCQVNMRAWINIAAGGMTAMEGELDKLDHLDVRALEAVVEANRDFVAGVKIRLGHPHNGRAGLERALQASSDLGLPLMAHIGAGQPPVAEIVAALRPGDILTHVYVAKEHCVVGPDGRLVDGVLAAKERGVLFDVAHGRTAFAWRVAEQAIAQGLTPDFLSTDLHLRNIDIPHMDLPSLMSKFMYLGFSLEQAVEMVTTKAAALLRLGPERGVLRPGARADVAVLRLQAGRFELSDADGQKRPVEQLLTHVQTVLAGRPMARRDPDPLPPYLRVPAPKAVVHACC